MSQAQTPPTIVQDITNQTILVDGNAVFVVAVDGTGPFTYQWQFNGTSLSRDIITTVAGTGAYGYSGDGGPATNALMANPYGLALDSSGNMFIADNANCRIRMIAPNGIISTVAGTNGELNGPTAVAVDSAGNLFIADSQNNMIRKVGTNGITSTVAGTGGYAYFGDGGPATNAWLNHPFGVAVDGAGNLFIADLHNSRVRKVGTDGIISTVAGTGAFSYSGDGGPATNASIFFPYNVALDDIGNLFIADSQNNSIRKVGTNGIISTAAGAVTGANLHLPQCAAVDSLGNLFIADTGNHCIRKVDTSGVISTIAGTGVSGYYGEGIAATGARLNGPASIVLDSSGSLLIADAGNNRVRKVGFQGSPALILNHLGATNTGNYQVIVSSPYGSVTSSVAMLTVAFPPGIATQPQSLFVASGNPFSLSVAASGTLPLSCQWRQDGTNLADDGNISGTTTSNLTISAAGAVHTGNYTVIVTNSFGAVTSGVAAVSVGLAPSITMQPINQAALDGAATALTVAASGTGPFTYQWFFNRTQALNNIITTYAGNGTRGSTGDLGAAKSAALSTPSGLVVDGAGNLFIADYSNNRIRKVTPDGIITTVAGTGTAGYSGDGGPATNATLYYPVGLALDNSGNLLIADLQNSRIRKVAPNGVISTLGGNGAAGYSGDGGPATNAAIRSPYSLAVDHADNLYIADFSNQRIRKVTPEGIISTVAGNGAAGYSGDGGPATNASLHSPRGVAVDASGNLFIADRDNNCIRMVATNGTISTMAGTGTYGYSGDGGPASSATLKAPCEVAVDAAGTLLIVDTGSCCVRQVATNGIISTVAGTGACGYGGDGGVATSALLGFPVSLALDSSGKLFVADTGNNRIRALLLGTPALWLNKIGAASAGDYSVIVSTPYGSVTSAVATLTVLFPPSIPLALANVAAVAGSPATLVVTATGTSPLAYQWYFNGAALADTTSSALAIAAFDPTNAGAYQVVVTNLFGAATSTVATLSQAFPPAITSQPLGQTITAGSNVMLTVAVSGTGPFSYQWQLNGTNVPGYIITSVAGKGSAAYSGDGGAATSAELNNPLGVAVGPSSNLFIVDNFNNRIRKVDTNGIITTLAGTNTTGYSGDRGPSLYAKLNNPQAVAVDGLGNLFIADNSNHRVRKVDTNGIITTVAGKGATGVPNGDGGQATNAIVAYPRGVAVDRWGNLFIAEYQNHRVRKVATNGIITTVAGSGTAGYSGDGGSATSARLNSPCGIAVDHLGNLFIADSANHRVRQVSTNGIISTAAGTGTGGYSGDGSPATGAMLNNPQGLAVDDAGNLLIVDYSNSRIREVVTNGIINTVVGNGRFGFTGDGGAATNARLCYPSSVAVDHSGNLFISDTYNHRIRKAISQDNPVLTLNKVGSGSGGDYTVIVSSPFGSVTSTVASVGVTLPLLSASLVLADGTNAASAVQFQFNGTIGFNYVLQCRTNFSGSSAWLPIITNTPGPNGIWSFTDTNTILFPARFFRIATP